MAKGHVALRVPTALGEVRDRAVLGPDDFFGELVLIAPDSARTPSILAPGRRRDDGVAPTRDFTILVTGTRDWNVG